MKELVLIRHAKSSWDNANVSDFQRPLNRRGTRDAPEMGRRLVAAQIIPDGIISSPAVRALTTARVMAEAVGHALDDVLSDDRIYAATTAELLGVVQGFAAHWRRGFLVGHNPAISQLAGLLLGEPVTQVPTCTVIQIHLRCEAWRDVAAGSGDLGMVDYPKREASG